MSLQRSCNDRRTRSAADAGPVPPRQHMGSSRATIEDIEPFDPGLDSEHLALDILLM